MKIKILTEEPSDKDLFKGGGHTRSAEAIKLTLINQPEIRIMGVEGELGGGKSTIIRLLKSILGSDNSQFIFIEFDLHQHHNSSIKNALINTIHDKFKEEASDDKDKQKRILSIKNIALGRMFEYTKMVKSNLSPVVLLFLLSIPFTVKFFEDALKNSKNILDVLQGNATYSLSLTATIISLAGYSLFILLVFLKPLNSALGVKNKSYGQLLGSIIKRDSEDTISEVLDISREVNSVDLSNAYVKFLKEAPKDKIIVLVIDNIDRINADDFNEVWSDLDIFVSHSNENIRIILPYSIAQVKNALKMDISEVNEFFSKKIPVSFTAPPLITYDWRNVFIGYFNEAFIDLDNKSLVNQCADLIEIWQETDIKITPRFLKSHVNKLASKALSLEENELSILSCSAYILAVQNPHIQFNQLISSIYFSKYDDIEDVKSHEIKRGKTLELLDNEMGLENRVRSIMCIHFQAPYNIAESEVLITPIKNAISSINAEAIMNLSEIYGFDHYFKHALQNSDIQKLSQLLAKISANVDESKNINKTNTSRKFINTWLAEINKVSESSNREIKLQKEYIESLRTLEKRKIDITTKPLKTTSEKLQNHLEKISKNKAKTTKTLNINSMLDQLYIASQYDDNTPLIIKKPSPALYVDFLWKNREKYKSWNIEKNSTNEEFRSSVLEYEFDRRSEDENGYDSLGWWFIKNNRLGDKMLEYETIFPNSVEKIGDISFSGLGSTSNTTALAQLTAKSITEEDNPQDCVALLFSHLISNKLLGTNIKLGGRNVNAWRHIKHLLDTQKGYEIMLPHFLTLMPKFADILKALENKEHQQYLSSSLTNIIKNNRIQRLSIKSIISSEDYNNLKNTYSGTTSNLLSWLKGWKEHVKVNHNEWNVDFLNDVIETNNSDFIDVIKTKFDNAGHDEDYFLTLINSPSSNSIKIVKYYIEKGWKIQNSSIIGNVIKNLFQDKSEDELVDYSNADWINQLLTIMPKGTLDSIIRKYDGRLLIETVSVIEKSSIIHNFHKWVTLKADSQETQKNIIILIEECDDDMVKQWLDKQNYSFESWNKKIKKALIHALSEVEGFSQIKKQLGE